MFRKYAPATLILLTIALLAVVCTKPDPTIAVIDKYSTLTLNDLRDALLGENPNASLDQYTITAAKTSVNKLVNDEIIYQTALEEGFENDPLVISEINKGYTKILLSHLYNNEILNKIIPESAVRDFYNNTDREVICKIIFFQFPPYAQKAQRDSVKAKADSVYNEIKKGADFVAMVKQFSDDDVSAKNDGYIGRLTWNRSKDPLITTAFSLREGQISRPVMNRMGYSILKTVEINKKENQQTYEEAKPSILNTLKAESKAALDAEAKKYWERLEDVFKLAHNDSVTTYWVEQFKTYGQTAGQVYDGLSKLDDETLDTELSTYSFGALTLRTVKDNLETFSENSRFYVDDAPGLQRYMLAWIQAEFLKEQAKRKNIHKLPAVRKEHDILRKYVLVTAYTSSKIIGNTNFTDEDVKRYFEEHKKEKYTIPEKRTVHEIFIKDVDTVQMVYDRLKAGVSFLKLAAAYTERHGYKEREGLLGDINENNWGQIGKEAFKLKLGQFSKPIRHEDDSGYSMIKISGIIPARTPDLDKIINRVKNDLKIDTVRGRREQWLNAKKAQLNISINEEVLKDVFK